MEVLIVVIFSLLTAAMIAGLVKKFIDFGARVKKLKAEGALSKGSANEKEENK